MTSGLYRSLHMALLDWTARLPPPPLLRRKSIQTARRKDNIYSNVAEILLCLTNSSLSLFSSSLCPKRGESSHLKWSKILLLQMALSGLGRWASERAREAVSKRVEKVRQILRCNVAYCKWHKLHIVQWVLMHVTCICGQMSKNAFNMIMC